MRLNKADLAKKLGCSERALTIWQDEGLPVLEHGRRGQPNSYDLAAVVAWLKRTGRGLMHFPRGGRRPIDIGALERELAAPSPAGKQAAEDLYGYLVTHLYLRAAARLYARRGVPIESIIEDLADVHDVLWTLFMERCGWPEDFAEDHENTTMWLYDEKDPNRCRLVERVYQAAAGERARLAPELDLGQGVETSAHEAPPDGPTG